MPPHGCKLLRISEAGDNAQLVGSTLHITQGGEIESIAAHNGTLTGVVKDLGRIAEGDLFFSLPEGPRSVRIGEENVVAKSRGNGIWAIPIKAKGRITVMIG